MPAAIVYIVVSIQLGEPYYLPPATAKQQAIAQYLANKMNEAQRYNRQLYAGQYP